MADKGNEESSKKPIEKSNIFRIKRGKIEKTSEQLKKEEDERLEQDWKRLKEVIQAEKMAAAKKNEETDSDEFEPLEGGTETEYSTEESDVKSVPSPKESSTNNPKGTKKNKNVEQVADEINQEEPSGMLSPTESSTSNPKGMKRVREADDDDEEEEDKEKKSKAADSSSADTCTSTFPNESVRSPPGDQGSKNV